MGNSINYSEIVLNTPTANFESGLKSIPIRLHDNLNVLLEIGKNESPGTQQKEHYKR